MTNRQETKKSEPIPKKAKISGSANPDLKSGHGGNSSGTSNNSTSILKAQHTTSNITIKKKTNVQH